MAELLAVVNGRGCTRTPEVVVQILIAEDSSTFRLILRELVKPLGHQVVLAENGQQAWDRFQREYFPVIITDWHMPEMDGMLLTRMVRAKPHGKYTYVILLTAHGGEDNYQEGIRAGVDDFLVKPPDAKLLAARLLVAERIVGVQNHVRQLEELLSVCAYCKDVQDGGHWIPIERYVARHVGTKSSHGICPKCWEGRVKPEMQQFGIDVSKGYPS
jgi:CheY-like chemotaxis protein